MITTIIILNLLVRFGVIKKGSKLHPEQVILQIKRLASHKKVKLQEHLA